MSIILYMLTMHRNMCTCTQHKYNNIIIILFGAVLNYEKTRYIQNT